MRHANDILGQVLLVVFFVLMGGIPLGILVLGILNFVRASTRRGTIVLQALAALLIWAFLSYALVLIFFMVVFSQIGDWKTTGVFILVCLIYAVVGAALIYWTKRQAKLSQAAPAS